MSARESEVGEEEREGLCNGEAGGGGGGVNKRALLHHPRFAPSSLDLTQRASGLSHDRRSRLETAPKHPTRHALMSCAPRRRHQYAAI
jgi:hypothetical protein